MLCETWVILDARQSLTVAHATTPLPPVNWSVNLFAYGQCSICTSCHPIACKCLGNV